eukprot:2942172-Karenia_brevis.AAC.1
MLEANKTTREYAPLESGISTDFGPGSDILAARHFVNKPLSYAKIGQVIKQLSALYPLNWSQSSAATYPARRTMPTISGELSLPDIEGAAIGNWKTQSGPDTASCRAVAAGMAVRYS